MKKGTDGGTIFFLMEGFEIDNRRVKTLGIGGREGIVGRTGLIRGGRITT